MNKTAIEYLTHTWNPIAMRCTPVSEGCENCWHRAMCKRHAANPAFTPEVRAAYGGGAPALLPDRLGAPLRRRKPAMIGVQFMGDLFHKDVPFDFIDKVFAVMALSPQHTFQILTKRPAPMGTYLGNGTVRGNIAGAARLMGLVNEHGYCDLAFAMEHQGQWPLASLWLGITAENQEAADERIPVLLQTPAAVRFVSLEPMLSAINVARYLGQVHADAIGLAYRGDDPWYSGIDWVICGGESGPGARPMHPDWPRKVRDDCQAAGVPFFFKHWGAYAPSERLDQDAIYRFHKRYAYGRTQCKPELIRYAQPDGSFVPPGAGCTAPGYVAMYRVRKKRAGRLLDGKLWEQYPATPAPEVDREGKRK